jgi:hypothetical protein
MTPMEKKAFENLLSLSPQKAPKDKSRHWDRIDDVLNQAKKSREKQAARDETPMPQMLKAMQEKMKDDRSAAQKVLLEQAVELDLQQVKKAFETAETDIELWKILHEAVLSRVTQLRLGEPAPTHKQKNRKSRSDKEATQKSLYPTFHIPPTLALQPSCLYLRSQSTLVRSRDQRVLDRFLHRAIPT